jgi:hypothetical protein
VLQYYCSDIKPENIGNLAGLHLLPTASETTCQLLELSSHSPTDYYYCNSDSLYALLSKYEKTAQRLVSNKIPTELVAHMLAGSISNRSLGFFFFFFDPRDLNIKHISPTVVAKLVSLILPSSTLDTTRVDKDIRYDIINCEH